jgi:hypothetical protein
MSDFLEVASFLLGAGAEAHTPHRHIPHGNIPHGNIPHGYASKSSSARFSLVVAKYRDAIFIFVKPSHFSCRGLGGCSLVVYSAERGRLEVTQLLVRAGADVNAGNK